MCLLDLLQALPDSRLDDIIRSRETGIRLDEKSARYATPGVFKNAA
jgi:hypothetical protein